MSLKLLLLVCLPFAMISVIVCEQSNHLENDPKFDARLSDVLAKSVLEFAQQLGTSILQDSKNPTEVFSPLSIYAVLTMVLLGANGKTYNEITNLLKLNDDTMLAHSPWKIHEQLGIALDDLHGEQPNPLHRRIQDEWQILRKTMQPSVFHRPNRNRNRNAGPSYQEISIANGIFVEDGFSIRPDYIDALQSTYKSTFRTMDFRRNAKASTASINEWIDKATKGKIPKMFADPLPFDTKVVIASALYFKALWERSFLEGATRPSDFYPDGIDRPPITVDMMFYGGASPYYDSKEYNCSIIGLPYRRNLTTMFVILPHNSTGARLRELQAKLSAEHIQDMISKMEWKSSIVGFPKLHLVNELNLNEILIRMGLRSLFNGHESDLTLLASGPSTVNTTFSPINDREELPQRDEESFVFERLGEENPSDTAMKHIKRSMDMSRRRRSAVTYKASSSNFRSAREPLRLKDLVIEKRITKSYPRKKNVSRGRRQALFSFPDIQQSTHNSLEKLQQLRAHLAQHPERNPGLYADDMLHKVDLTINEAGTEGAAATAVTMRRTGPEVLFRADAPFLFIISHDDTRLPLFYGAVFKPTNQ